MVKLRRGGCIITVMRSGLVIPEKSFLNWQARWKGGVCRTRSLKEITVYMTSRNLHRRRLNDAAGNRIRDRLEALEALVEDKAKTQISNSSKGSEYAESTTSNGASRKVTHHTQLLTPEDSSVLPDDSTSWNFNDFSEASAAHFDSMYSFSEPNTPMEIYQPKSASPSAFDEDVPNADPSLANQPSLGISSATAVKKQLAVAGTEDLDSSTVNSSQPESTSSVAQAAPGKTSGQSNFHHAFSYGYPVSPLSGAVQPLMPSPYPGKPFKFH